LHWSTTEYDKARYERTLSLAAELLGMTDSRTAEEIEQVYRGDLSIRSPFVAADAAIFDGEGRLLLVQRADNERWCMPGGLADVGEPPSRVAEREVWEETGLEVRATRLVGVFDSRTMRAPYVTHLYNLTFLCEIVGGALSITHETLAYGYFTEEQLSALPIHGTNGYRIPYVFRTCRGEIEQTFFH
jgi:8-oxo-dGTP pyrophosphatase MutT (NUDIX family)